MGFKLAELFVDIVGKDGKLQSLLSGIHSRLEGLKEKCKGVSLAAGGIFAAGAAAVGLFAHDAIEAERAASRLKAALEASGQEVEGNFSKISEVADRLKGITIFDDDEVKEAATLATHLGITGDQMEACLKAGVGLSQFMGGDLKAGTEAAAKAFQGNYRELRTLIPQFAALSDSELMAKVGSMMSSGFKEAQRDTESLGGQFAQLRIAVGDLGKALGAAFLPYIQTAVNWIKNLVSWFQSLDPAIASTIAKFVLIGGAVAGFIALLPVIIGFISTLVTVIGILISPVTLVIAAVAALATGIMYLAGTGDTFAERMTSGFFNVLSAVIQVVGYILHAITWLADKILTAVNWIVDGWLKGFQLIAKGVDYLTGTHLSDWFQEQINNVDALFGKVADANQAVQEFSKTMENADAKKLREGVGKVIDDIKGALNLDKLTSGSPEKKELEAIGPINLKPPIHKDEGDKDKQLKGTSAEDYFKNDFISRMISRTLNGDKPKKDDLPGLTKQLVNLGKQQLDATNDMKKELLKKLHTGYQ